MFVLPKDISIQAYRQLARCVKPEIDAAHIESEEILALIEQDTQLDFWYHKWVTGEISRSEYFEAVETIFGTKEMDSYISEIDLNLEHLCKHVDSHRANSSGLQLEQIQRRFGD